MKYKHHTVLQAELQQAGATQAELISLDRIGASLHLLGSGQPVMSMRLFRRALPSMVTGLVCLMIGVGSVMLAQASIPGQPLYGIKQMSERTVATFSPAYRENIMLRRAHEVGILVNRKAPSATVIATLRSYTKAAADYRLHDTDVGESDAARSPVMTFCKQTLMLAESESTGAEHIAIAQTVATL